MIHTYSSHTQIHAHARTHIYKHLSYITCLIIKQIIIKFFSDIYVGSISFYINTFISDVLFYACLCIFPICPSGQMDIMKKSKLFFQTYILSKTIQTPIKI